MHADEFSQSDGSADSQRLAEALSALGYPGFLHLQGQERRDPAEVLLAALVEKNLETRLAEALPWLALHHSELRWEWLVKQATVRGVQNQLGFVVSLARQVAERNAADTLAARLRPVERDLEAVRVLDEATLGRASMTKAERHWLRLHRSLDAQRWNLLTDLVPEHLPYTV
jgi:hypothetical protein